jgi:hypothetical protein
VTAFARLFGRLAHAGLTGTVSVGSGLVVVIVPPGALHSSPTMAREHHS